MSAPKCVAHWARAVAPLLVISAPWLFVTAAEAQLPSIDSSLDTSIYADNQEDTYRRCLNLANTHPETGFDMARRWVRLDGGEPAEHCAAAALVGLGDPEEAAKRMQILAQKSTAAPRVKSGLWAHAGRAWMDSADFDQALVALNTALSLNSGNSEVYVDRALCHAVLGDLWSAIDDLNQVVDRHPDAQEALVLRSSAYRQLEIYDLALDDIDRAIQIDPNSVDTLLEKGLLGEALGEMQAARRAWVQVLELAPDSPAADAVRKHLERVDVGSDSSVTVE